MHKLIVFILFANLYKNNETMRLLDKKYHFLSRKNPILQYQIDK